MRCLLIMVHRMACAQRVGISFRDARKAVQRYDELRVIHEFCTHFDAAAYRAGERDVGHFRKDMVLLK